MLIQEYTDILKSLIESDRLYLQMSLSNQKVSEMNFMEYFNYK